MYPEKPLFHRITDYFDDMDSSISSIIGSIFTKVMSWLPPFCWWVASAKQVDALLQQVPKDSREEVRQRMAKASSPPAHLLYMSVGLWGVYAIVLAELVFPEHRPAPNWLFAVIFVPVYIILLVVPFISAWRARAERQRIVEEYLEDEMT